MDQAFEYAEKNFLISEKIYPYMAVDGTCKSKDKKPTKEEVSTYKDVTLDSPSQLKAAAANQPVSVGIEADKACFQFYKTGILSGPSCGTNIDHGVLVVGYGTDSGQDYWLVKNSWGVTWGDHGYLKIARNSGIKQGVCGILSGPPSVPTMK